MTRRTLLSLPAGLAAEAPAEQPAYPGVSYRDYSRCLPDYLRRLAAAAYRRRNEALQKVTTAAQAGERRRWARETFWKLAGGMPERTPLNPQKTGEFERDGYRVEKVVYESRPRFHIPANLYIPTAGRPPFPGVLFQMGHSVNGKAAELYQACCQGLARLGYVVLAFDPMGQGERIYYPAADGRASRLGSADDEHTLPGKQMLLIGDTSTRLQTWDAVRSLDYLASLPMVDPKRLGTTGNSGGGTLSMLLVAADDRVTAAAPACPNSENFACADFNPPGSTDDAEQNLLNAGPLGYDRWDLFYPFAPKPLLIIVSDKDFFGTYSPRYISSGWEEFGKLKRFYGLLGKTDTLQWAGSPLPHGLSYSVRLAIYSWFNRHLKGDATPVTAEPPVKPERDETLWVVRQGNVVTGLGSRTPFDMNRERAEALPAAHEPETAAKLLGVDRTAAKVAVLRRVPSVAVDVEAIEVASAPGVWMPAWLFLPRRVQTRRAAIVALEPGGRNGRWGEGGLYQNLAAEGHPVCVPDVRGIGDLTPEFPRGAARHGRPHQEEEHYAWASLMLGKPLLGQRVTDILAMVGGLKVHAGWKGRRLVVAALGKMTVPALFAALLDSSIQALYLAGGLVSFADVVRTEEFNHPFASFVPDLLRHTDLPRVADSIAPRRLILGGTVNAAGRRMPADEVRAVYTKAEIRADARWDLETLAGAAGE